MLELLDNVALLSDGTEQRTFRLITEEESAVYDLLFPTKETSKEIPENIPEDLKLRAAEFRALYPNSDFTIQSPKTVAPDPILLGHVLGTDTTWRNVKQTYTLGRWGEALAPFKEQLKAALLIAKTKCRRTASIAVKRATLDLQSIDDGDISPIQMIQRATGYTSGYQPLLTD